MGVRDKTIYLDSDNLATLVGLVDNTDDSYINDATVLLSIYNGIIKEPTSGGAMVDKTGGKVGIPLVGHSLDTGTPIRLAGFKNYNEVYLVDGDSSADEIVITATYVAEVLTEFANIYVGYVDAHELVMVYVAASDGNYEIAIPDTVDIFDTETYWCFIAIEDTASNKKLIRIQLQAGFATS